MKKSSSLLLITIIVSAVAQTSVRHALAGTPREQTKVRASQQEETEAIEPAPKTACSCNNSGVDKQLIGNLAGAIADFNEAIELDPNFAAAWNNRGNARFALGEFQAAIADYTRAIALEPGDATAYYNRGKAREVSGDAQGALADYNRATALNRNLIPPAAV